MIWRYELIYVIPRPGSLGKFFAHDLEAAKATAESALRNVTAAGSKDAPDAVRLLDQSGKEIWRSRARKR
jgi:hypothetical protein